MPQLLKPEEILCQTQYIARIIKSILLTIKIKPTILDIYKITQNFNLAFTDTSTDIYVINNTVYIPLMPINKINALPNYLTIINLPYVFEHEACHLLDNQFCKDNYITIPYDILENRAETIELLCKNKFNRK